MENTGKLLFEDAGAQWYVALGDRWIGPLTAADVYAKILAQEISWAHYIWKNGQASWKRICDIKIFQAAVPSTPAQGVQSEVKEAAKPVIKQAVSPRKKTDPREWFLYYNDTQYGPFAKSEMVRLIEVKKIHGRVHAWKDGMPHWQRLEKIQVFHPWLSKKTQVQAIPQIEMRNSPRSPMVARILMANDESVIVAMCRDISVGGMQVLTDRLPGKVGARIKFNVSPAAKDESKGQMEPFVAEGVILRVLEDGRGFSFRFERISDQAKRAIEKYLATG